MSASNGTGSTIAIASLVVAIIAVIVAVTVPELRELVGLDEADDGFVGCSERLADDPTPPVDDETRVRPPTGFAPTYQRSTRLDGRVSARLEWSHSDPAIASGLLAISGRRGEADPMDQPVRLDDDLPPPGTCGVWIRQYVREGPQQTVWTVTVEGLWADETYCFAVNAADEDGGTSAPIPSVNTEAICRRAPWDDAWGAADRPPG